jgi:DNA-binding transcriptional regulator YiaG
MKLTDEQVRELREKFASGARQVDLAAEYGISQNSVSSLVIGRTRRSAGGPLSLGTAQKLDAEEVRLIREKLASGTSQTALAREHGVSQQMIGQIASGRAFADVGGPLIGAKRASALSTSAENEPSGVG